MQRQNRRQTAIDVGDIARRIRAHLDTDRVVNATADEMRSAFGASRTSVWLASGRAEPVLAFERGRAGAPSPNRERSVWRATATRQPVRDRTDGLAVPMIAPRSGLLGVIYCEAASWSEDAIAAAEDIAREAALALESANLYEQAIAEKEKSEAILARVGDAIIVTGAHGEIREWNPAAERMTGTASIAAEGKHCEAAVGLFAGERALDCTNGCPLIEGLNAATAHEGQQREVWRATPSGRRQPILASASPIIDADGNVSSVVHSLRDITKLKQADEAKTLFLATASHELKTPLTVIQGFAQLLTARAWDDETDRKVALEAIERRAKELNRIVERLLLSSRIEAGRAEVRMITTSIAPMLRERCAAMAGATGQEISLSIEGELLAMVDPDAFATVIDHLLDNAVKYSPDGGPISITADEEAARIVVRIVDQGIGMDPEQAEHCFDKFWQGESSDVRRFGGTGIGLYIVRSLAEAMGGSVRAESTLGAGATFVLTLAGPGAPAEPPEVPPRDDEGAPSQRPEPSAIREFMRQIGVPPRREP